MQSVLFIPALKGGVIDFLIVVELCFATLTTLQTLDQSVKCFYVIHGNSLHVSACGIESNP